MEGSNWLSRLMEVWRKYGDRIVGVKNGLALWIFVVLIFAAGFYLSFRAAYGSKISS
jgi:hypothetical protein